MKLLKIENTLNEIDTSLTPEDLNIVDFDIPAGTIMPFAGSTIPDGYLLCDGSALSRTIYNRLYSAIATHWGAGNGTTTFNLPNLQGIYLRGTGGNASSLGALQAQGTKKNGLTATISAPTLTTTNRSLSGGSTTTVAQPSHQHPTSTGSFRYADGSAGGGAIVSGATSSTQAHSYFGTTTEGISNNNHTHTVTGTLNIAHSHPAPTMSLGTGGGVTRPVTAFVNYIIRY